MNLKDIRAAVFSQADWGPKQSTDAKSRLDDFINRAYFQLALEAPFLFFEDTVQFATMPDKVGTATDTVSILTAALDTAGAPGGGGDRWVIHRENAMLTDLWDQTGRWDARMIELTDSSGEKYRRQIRHIWTDVGTGRQRISLFTPWHNTTDTGMTYRIYTDSYYMPDDVIDVNSIRLHEKGQDWPLTVVGQLEAEQLSFKDIPAQVAAGVPRTVFRSGHFRLDAPTVAPQASASSSKWVGPEHAGSFDYVYTYCWGQRDPTYRTPGIRTRLGVAEGSWQPGASVVEPLFESPPSPLATLSTKNTDSAIDLLFPSPGYLQGFGQDADARYKMSGWYIRVYRRRTTVDSTAVAKTSAAAYSVGEEYPEKTDEFFLIYQFGDEAASFTFTDDGSYLPDYHRRLREAHGYEGVAFYPRPDDRYEVEVRCVRRPARLGDDYDTPSIHVDGMDCLIHKTLILLYETQGNAAMADRAISRYQENIFTLSKRYGDLRYPAEVTLRRPARAHRVVNARRPFRRWYNLP